VAKQLDWLSTNETRIGFVFSANWHYLLNSVVRDSAVVNAMYNAGATEAEKKSSCIEVTLT